MPASSPPVQQEPRPGTPDDLLLPAYIERRRQARGLLLLALAAVLFSILRAGLHHTFAAGWWRLW